MTESKRSIDIILVEEHTKTDGKKIGIVSKEVLDELNKIVNESEKYNRAAEKLRLKNEKALRAANKLMKQIITSHHIQFDYNKEAVGVSRTDKIYVGPKERVKESPDAEPQQGDRVVGTLVRYERRKYDELLSHYEYLANKTKEHNEKVFLNEEKLVSFEQQILSNQEYNPEKEFVAVYPNGYVFLCSK